MKSDDKNTAGSRARHPRSQGSPPKLGRDGFWHAYVSLGNYGDGSRNRVHIRRRSYDQALEEFEKALAQAEAAVRTVGDWLDYWLHQVVTQYAKPSTWANYEGAIRREISPRIGNVKLVMLTQHDVEELARSLPSRSTQAVLKTLRAALGEAWRQHLVDENVAERVRVRASEPILLDGDDDWETAQPGGGPSRRALSIQDLRAIITEIRTDRLRARWTVGIIGLRRAEALGLIWPDLTDDGVLQVLRNRVRPSYRHGCAKEGSCGRSPGRCPVRIKVGEIVPLKADSSRRDLPLGPAVRKILQEHRTSQINEHLSQPGARRSQHDWMFTDVKGGPLSHDADYRLWKQLLKRAGVDAAYKPHELRHTAASLMGATDVTDATLMGLMGWSTSRMVDNYRHPLQESMRKALEGFEKDLFE